MSRRGPAEAGHYLRRGFDTPVRLKPDTTHDVGSDVAGPAEAGHSDVVIGATTS